MAQDQDHHAYRDQPVDDLLTTLYGLLAVAHDRSVNHELHARCRLDVSWEALDLVRLVGEMQPVTLARVASASHRAEREVLTMVQELQHRGLILRRPDRHDRRTLHLSLTPAGRQVNRTRHRVVADAARQVVREWHPGEARALTDLLTRYTHGLAGLVTDART